MFFRTKKELLEYLGKNAGDNKLVDRMVIRGDVIKTVDGYEYKDAADETRARLEEVEKELEMYKECCDKNAEDYNELLAEFNEYKEKNPAGIIPGSSITKEFEELQINYEYLQNKFRRLKRGYEIVIDETYNQLKRYVKIGKDEYKEQLTEAVHEALEEQFGRED